MPRVLLLATTTGYQTRAFGDAAERLGVHLAFATDRCDVLDDPWQDEAIPIRFHDEARSVAAILESARARPLDGVLVVGDRPTVIGARVAQALGLLGHPPEATAIARHKQRTHERLQKAGLPVPWFASAHVDSRSEPLASTLSFPCVLKPVALSGSRGVMRADDAQSFCAAFERLRALLQSPEIRAERTEAREIVLVEGFIPGREFALEGLLHHGVLHVFALFDKPDPLDGPFFEETIYLTPSSMPRGVQTAIIDGVACAAQAIGLRHGPIHAECRVNDRGVFVLEVAARPIGGLCARALRFEEAKGGQRDGSPCNHKDSRPAGSLLSLEELLLRHALGESPDKWRRESLAAGVMMIPIPARGVYRGVAGVEDAQLVAGVDQVRITARTDQLLVPLPEGASYLGFIFARGDNPDAVWRSLCAAHARLHFAVEPELRILAPR